MSGHQCGHIDPRTPRLGGLMLSIIFIMAIIIAAAIIAYAIIREN
jgi:hypothetical protein